MYTACTCYLDLTQFIDFYYVSSAEDKFMDNSMEKGPGCTTQPKNKTIYFKLFRFKCELIISHPYLTCQTWNVTDWCVMY